MHPRATTSLGVLLLAIFVLWLVTDTSDDLNSEQTRIVRQFVLWTQSQAVRERFNLAVEDGHLTVNETRAVIEVAKQAEPGYGLISDQKNNNSK